MQNSLSGEVLKSITDSIKTEIETMIDEKLAEANKHIEHADNQLEKAQEYYKIKAKTKYDLSSYIKKRLGVLRADEEYEEVKARVFLLLSINKWEDLDINKIRDILPVIDESIKVIKAERPQQLSMWE